MAGTIQKIEHNKNICIAHSGWL